MVHGNRQHRWAATLAAVTCIAATASLARANGGMELGGDLGLVEPSSPSKPLSGDPDLTNGGRRPVDSYGRGAGRTASRTTASRQGTDRAVVVIRIQTALNAMRVFWLHI